MIGRSNALTDHVGALRASFRVVRAAHPFLIDAVVVLPDHLHIVMTLPDGDADFSSRLSLVKRRFTDAVQKAGVTIPRRNNSEAAPWQRRFWEHTIRDDRDFGRHLDYMHFNPVEHGLVARVRDWPYSSFRRYVRDGILPIDWGGDLSEASGTYGER